MKNLLVILSSATLICALPMVAQATAYKWVDENGKTNYSNTKPEGVINVQTVKANSKASSSAQAEIQKLKDHKAAELDQEAKTKTAQEDIKKQSESTNIKAKNCETAKTNLAQLIEHRRVKKVNLKGQLEKMSQKEIDDKVAKAQADVKTYCEPELPS